MKTQRRFAEHPKVGRVWALDEHHPAAVEGRTRYPKTVKDHHKVPRILVSAVNNKKIGSPISRGKWRGMPVYTLTLEERKTCPRSCHHWLTCYGNKMHHARRVDLKSYSARVALMDEVTLLAAKHPRGFVVRLHVLGDFFSVEYVRLWGLMLLAHHSLHVYGYTARDQYSKIGEAITLLNKSDRALIRWSNQQVSAPHTSSAKTAEGAPKIVCPAQIDKTAACGTCGLCWDKTVRNITFIDH